MTIPFDAIRATSLRQAPQLLADWFPHGKQRGQEFKVGSLSGEPGESLSVNLSTGLWRDFAANVGGHDLIDLYAKLRNQGDRVAAARELGIVLGITVNGTRTQFRREQPREWQPMVPPPVDVGRPSDDVFSGFDLVHEYTDLSDHVTHYVGRIEARGDRRKQFVPVTFGVLNGKRGWHRRGPDAPKPLYGLNRLSHAAPDAMVVVAEGEKKADAVQRMFPEMVGMSWMGGAQSVDGTDWSPLEGRRIIIWPDGDRRDPKHPDAPTPGEIATAALRKRFPDASIVDISGLSDIADGYDAWDLERDGCEDPDAWLQMRLREPEQPASTADALGIWDAGTDAYNIPPRGWLLGTAFCRKFLSSVIADGGIGKTALRVLQLISLATGRSLTGEHVFQRCRVLLASLEDDKDELRRRVYAVLRHHGLKAADIKGWLFLAAPKGLRLAEVRDGTPQPGALKGWLDDAIAAFKPDIVSLDPFIKSHGLGENDNNAIDYVCTLLSTIAIDRDIAIDLPHHTNKGIQTAGDANRGRGASASKDAARLVYTLTPMTADEAQQFGLDEGERRRLVRLDSAKINIAPPSSAATWFRLVGVPLSNGNDAYPNGDTVQTVERWTPPELWADLDSPLLQRILDDIDAGLPNGSRYSAANRAGDRAAWRVLVHHAPGKSEKQAQEVIKAWMKSGLLYAEDYEDPEQRKQRTGLRVNSTKRPS